MAYVGKAFYVTEESGRWFDGISSFDVDFANKTVNGEIKAAGRTIKLPEANITGHSFSAKQGRGKNEERIRGHFFGENAAELGGLWGKETNGKGEAAVFGATKQ